MTEQDNDIIELIEEEISTITIEDLDLDFDEHNKLVLFNDDTTSFDHVIECLCRYLEIDSIAAEQIALIVHTKGKCIIKEGTYESLTPIYEALAENLLIVEIQ